MGSDELLVIAMALPPMWLAARLWWSARQAFDELRDSAASALRVQGAELFHFEAANAADGAGSRS